MPEYILCPQCHGTGVEEILDLIFVCTRCKGGRLVPRPTTPSSGG